MFVRKDKLHAVDEDCKTDGVSSGVQLNEDSNLSQGSSNHGHYFSLIYGFMLLNLITTAELRSVIFKNSLCLLCP